MPKVGMEPIRRKALVNATISEIGRKGSLDVTVSQIAKRAGMSSALAHHYFGGKDQIFLAAMRHILSVYGAQVRAALLGADTPRTRVEAIVRANFEAGNFRPEVIAAWLNFYVLSQSSDGARRLLAVYQHRLHSNLVYGLRPLVKGDAQDVHDLADMIAAQIDGQFIRHALREETPSGKRATAQVLDFIDVMLKARGQ
ncbi:HTH-type transcriptional regulator BetI [Aliiroseovarius sp. xm-m-379]|uniref:choline-binding transcriptional repressor BetI n=1 Tax=unclassified Aliiroseovarius TaxID=2623558 RepID=UPI001567D9F9|nr:MULTISPECIES: transcriptional regulator BetI [unclassified Aliiroseovarius]NRP11261.1 HTH-type transcriptional regulator BetI [Aliiroseovarius sp. xm-d-517]NRP23759.1 HTH-type transcriptional regulator BetI [Aliiroseovarius sp. xm-m-379]NRP28995.1 HTH-type transcriptional regulator BetI [Aliiroseovarius sp. xm-m-314]NRP32558.1 HTH-type transcriptional regulator BetI [Aliiroseovarius sp. xm-a-104]NRP41091.1 HTH-type transcriptional regulator BetI [Aliiroseovarius sp. xm-m-339-2]